MQKRYSIKKIVLLITIVLIAGTSCKKYLDVKSADALGVPSSVNDLQLLMDGYATFNTVYCAAGEIGTDDFYVTTPDFLALYDVSLRNYYSWQKDDAKQLEWSSVYRAVLYTNTVLELANKIPVSKEETVHLQQVRGEAFFFRAFGFYNIAQVFASPYNAATAPATLGIPIRLSSDFNVPSVRSNLQVSYDQIINDFLQSIPLLPLTEPVLSRPTKKTAYAALARTYLTMQLYDKAKLYADSSLQLYSTLIDYNTIDSTVANPFSGFNKEVLLTTKTFSYRILSPSVCKVDSNLYNMFSSNDLRKVLYFQSNGNGSYKFKGSYADNNNSSAFCGYSTDEMFLIRAEVNARANNIADAMNDLNTLLITRYKTNSFVPLTAVTSDEALQLVLDERRKELCFRCHRWTDLRRLNLVPATAITLTRLLDGKVYTLSPNSPAYTIQIPKVIINLSNLQQNP